MLESANKAFIAGGLDIQYIFTGQSEALKKKIFRFKSEDLLKKLIREENQAILNKVELHSPTAYPENGD